MTAPRGEDAKRKPFSGEIIFRRTAIPRGAAPLDWRDLGEQHYFISGPHWKLVDESGATTALYDPETHLIHYFKPETKIVDASTSDSPARFELLPETRVILGRKCKGVRWTTSESTTTGFYDPDLFVDAALYSTHHYGNWAETLALTHGALMLWSKVEVSRGDIVSEPVSIVLRDFDASFWAVPKTAISKTSSTTLGGLVSFSPAPARTTSQAATAISSNARPR